MATLSMSSELTAIGFGLVLTVVIIVVVAWPQRELLRHNFRALLSGEPMASSVEPGIEDPRPRGGTGIPPLAIGCTALLGVASLLVGLATGATAVVALGAFSSVVALLGALLVARRSDPDRD